MKRQMLAALQFIVAAMLLLFLNNCDKEHCMHTYTLYKPIFSTLTQARANMKSNPAHGLKNTGKMYVYGNYIFLNELNEGIHIIDNSQPSSPKNIAFINIPGNLDLAVLGNTLYADSYSDLVAFDITDPLKVTAKKFLDNVFPQRSGYYRYSNSTTNPDSIQVISGWETHDTTVSCERYSYLYSNYYALATADQSGSYASPGMGGSMARFTITNNHLYAVTYYDLNIFDLSTPQQPVFANKTHISDMLIETIYPFKNKLFIGSNGGVFMYDISTPGNPVKQSQFTHVRSCDPVIADDNYAWATLRSGTSCSGNTNELDVINISNITAPTFVKTYFLSNPQGLSKDGNVLFVCDTKDGLEIFDATNPENIQLIKQISGLEPSDVIAWNNRALVIAKDGLYQFDYSDLKHIYQISKIGLN
jgi:hypothetical protein